MNIYGARIDSAVVSRLGEIMRPYMLPGLEDLLAKTAETRTSRWNIGIHGEGDVNSPSDSEVELAEAIAEGGRWHLSSLRLTDARGVESSLGPVAASGLAIVDGARELHFKIAPFVNHLSAGPVLDVDSYPTYVVISLVAPDEYIAELFDEIYAVLSETVPPVQEPPVIPPPPFRVFIAYGGGRAWEVVRDYLRAAGFDVDAFTEVERAGQLTLDVVEEMIRSSSVAVIVMTGADKVEGGAIHARQNVVHEAGFAQGAIGRRNTIILREEGVTLPTNVAGLTYIEFDKGEIHTTRERVVALVNRLQTQSRSR